MSRPPDRPELPETIEEAITTYQEDLAEAYQNNEHSDWDAVRASRAALVEAIREALAALVAEIERLREATKELEWRRQVDELSRNDHVWIFHGPDRPEICCNDVFCPAADSEDFVWSDVPEIMDYWRRGRENGLYHWIAKRRGIEPKRWRGQTIPLQPTP